MPVRRRTTRRVTRPRRLTGGRRRRTTRRTMRGRGWFSDAWSKIKSIIPSWSTIKDKALSYGRTNKVLSTLAGKLGAGENITGAINKLTGMGRRRRTTRRRTMRGRGFFGDIWGGIKNVGRTIAPAVGNMVVKKLTGGRRRRVGRPRMRGRGLLSMFGLGRRTTRRRTMRGRGILGSVLGGILPF